MENQVSINLKSIVVQSNDQVSAKIDEEAVMMSIEQGKYYGLDEIGTRIWKLLEQPQSVSEILKTLMKEYEVDNETCEKDVLNLLNGLFKEKLISVTQ
jgi:hypothetical protein